MDTKENVDTKRNEGETSGARNLCGGFDSDDKCFRMDTKENMDTKRNDQTSSARMLCKREFDTDDKCVPSEEREDVKAPTAAAM
ncbi:uncharacterized protein LOC119167111 isoform X6 [Rhipicephalus microplus]|uniref:uncharacterized protein LOC119167111 isoform X6 n=1 Tax=Rhipicephalus microplus TaxID=6941 RepID=UPI003F6CB60A